MRWVPCETERRSSQHTHRQQEGVRFSKTSISEDAGFSPCGFYSVRWPPSVTSKASAARTHAAFASHSSPLSRVVARLICPMFPKPISALLTPTSFDKSYPPASTCSHRPKLCQAVIIAIIRRMRAVGGIAELRRSEPAAA